VAAGGNNDVPVPVFIALNEFNQVKEENRQGFILNYIRENYCDSSTSIEEIWDAMKQPVPKDAFKPRVVLLLDGFNEITVEKKELLLEIKPGAIPVGELEPGSPVEIGKSTGGIVFARKKPGHTRSDEVPPIDRQSHDVNVICGHM
jgi:hypothetical protein